MTVYYQKKEAHSIRGGSGPKKEVYSPLRYAIGWATYIDSIINMSNIFIL